MKENFLYTRLDRVVRRERMVKLYWKVAACWLAATVIGAGVLVLEREFGMFARWSFPLIAGIATALTVAFVISSRRTVPDYRGVALRIERHHPELKGLLMTAVQLRSEGKEPSYLEYRVLQSAIERSQQSDWREIVPAKKFRLAQAAPYAAVLLFTLVLMMGGGAPGRPATMRLPFGGLAVTPGNTMLERGESLIVLARFGGVLPAGVDLVVNESGSPTRKLPLIKSLADPVFGGSVAEVKSDLLYHLEYAGKRSPEYKVTVFEHPRLERADAELTFPAYTNQPTKRIEDTRRISAVEGTKLDLSLQLNKPVKSAKLVARNKEKTTIPLQVTADKALATLPGFPLAASQSYDLQLVDSEGRANKVAAPFVIDVVTNRPPEIKLASPRGDLRPSALEEITFDGTVWDDFGTPAYGLAYNLAGGETKTIELGHDAGAKEKRAFNHVLGLETLGVQPDQLLSWYVWADDMGPDGKLRRTNGDLYFAEIRPFDEVFKESQDMPSGDQQQQQGGQGNQARKLTELQKQIMNATWKLQRDSTTPKYKEDTGVVQNAQEDALKQANSSKEDAMSPRTQALWTAATKQMEEAVEHLKEATGTPKALAQALTAEQGAYQALLKLQQRETQVSRSRGGGGGQGGDQGNQRQLDQLDLTQTENRYETQRQASPPQSPERREQSQVMNRLQELARRQQDLNDRLKEMQMALQEAKTEQQKEELRRQLKRLQDEQRQMLADADELKQRMDRPENQSRMNEQRQQLEQARDDLQRAADATNESTVGQAVASGTRAQRQLQDMRDELRKQNSSEFSEDLRNMRSEARELARDEEEISRKLGGQNDPRRKSLSAASTDEELLNQLQKQQERMKSLVERATEVSQQAETSEPLLSRQLYDSIRKVTQDEAKSVKEMQRDLLEQGIMTRDLSNRLKEAAGKDEAGKSLELTANMLREGYMPQATQAEQKARAGINDLRRGVERAAESVLGDDTEALKLAQSELDAVTNQLQKEMAQDGGDQKGQGQRGRTGDPSKDKTGNGAAAGNDPAEDGQKVAGASGRQGDKAGKDSDDLANADSQGQGGEGKQSGKQPGRAERDGDRQKLAQNDSSESKSGEGQPGQSGQPGESGKSGQTGKGSDSQSKSRSGSNTASNESQSGGQSGGEQSGSEVANNGTDRANRGGPQNRQLAGGDRNNTGGGNRGSFNFDDVFNDTRTGVDRGAWNGGAWNGGAWNGGPILGENFAPWADRLRDVEEVLDQPELREAVAAARERARLARVEYRRDMKKPDWAVVQLQIVKPLLEVRNRITEELARRESKDSLVPIDRDPVPNRYAESVRKYYESLGKEGSSSTPE